MIGSATFSTNLSSRLGLGIICLGLAALCLVAAFEAAVDGAYGDTALALAPATGFTAMWLYYATISVVVTSEFVEVRRYWRPVWRSARHKVTARIGRGGEMKTHTVLILESPENRPIEPMRTLFGKQTLSQLVSLLGVQEQIPDTIF